MGASRHAGRDLERTAWGTMTTLDNRPNTALLVIDVQSGVGHAHEREAVVANVATLVYNARTAGVDVVWVQDSSGNLTRDSENWNTTGPSTGGVDLPGPAVRLGSVAARSREPPPHDRS